MIIASATDFLSWRDTARKLLNDNIEPSKIIWNQNNNQISLFAEQKTINPNNFKLNISAEFIKLAEMICYHRSVEKYDLLYRMLWRLLYENKHLLKISSDPLTNTLELMVKAIRRDVHKTKAFVRFRKIIDVDNVEHYIAWHKPDHYTLKLSSPFFVRRFAIMRWTILTPDESVHWDCNNIHFGPGAKASDAPNDDQMEELWKEFYRAIFNPARIKIKAMKREMPVRHWPTLPETSIIKDMLEEADKRVKKMIAHQEGHTYSAADFIPESLDLKDLKQAAAKCKGCPLYKHATQTVFGVGPQNAKVMIVGEQPGDVEDKTGQPFQGPAGQILNNALNAAGIDREQIYITNAVKHFKFDYHNNFRKHITPNLQDIVNCKPWLEAELRAIKPELVICLGLTATRALIDPRSKLEQIRGKFIHNDNVTYLSTYHPSAILRNKDSEKDLYRILVADLILVKNRLSL
jgi:DNA polymerase